MHDIMGSLASDAIKTVCRDKEHEHPHADILSNSKLGVDAFTYFDDSARESG